MAIDTDSIHNYNASVHESILHMHLRLLKQVYDNAEN